jgi:hypothetical protein
MSCPALCLTREDQEEIIRRHNAGETAAQLAAEFGIDRTTVRRWSRPPPEYVEPPPPPECSPLMGSQGGRSAAELDAAGRLVTAFEARADYWQEGAPLWHGWSIHMAFLLGIRYARRHPVQEEG